MADKTTLDILQNIAFEQLGVAKEQITESARIQEDLGADSLDLVEFIMALEEEFDIEISDEDAEKLSTVGDVVKYVDQKLKDKE